MVITLKPFVALAIDFLKNRKNKLSFKVFFCTFVSLLTTLSICFFILNVGLSRLARREFEDYFKQLFQELNFYFEQFPLESLESITKDFGRENQMNITVANPVNYNEIVIQYIYWDNLEDANTISSDWYSITNELSGVGFLLHAKGSLENVNQVINNIQRIMPILFIVSAIISVVVSMVQACFLARPIVKISELSKKLQKLDLNHSYEIKRNDEIGKLAYNLNKMANKLNQSLTELYNANEKLKIDMEQKQLQEQRRRDLFTAISHELKTPLSILKGELEGMIDKVGAYQNRDYYLQRAYQTTEKMEESILQLLLISRLDTTSEQLTNYQYVNINDLIANICQSYEEMALKKKISLTYYCEDDLWIRVNEMQLKHALFNIVSNAIFYSPTNEFVNIQATSSNAKISLTIENTGAYIDLEELDNIFEPFYRIDKSRNSRTGGSGLGLYIVKRILDLHATFYEIKNTQDGVCFSIEFCPVEVEVENL